MEATEPQPSQDGYGFGERSPHNDDQAPRSPRSPRSPISPVSPRGLFARDPKSARLLKSEIGGKDTSAATTGGRWTSGMRLLGSTTTKPLLPVTERRSEEGIHIVGRRLRADSSADEKFDITPDGGSAGREGRQFTVANVGNNGRIYLRPTVRPANQRYPQPTFVFPITPPGTARIDALAEQNMHSTGSVLHDSQWTDTPLSPATPVTAATPSTVGSFSDLPTHPPRPSQHRRAHSDSTAHDGATIRNDEAEGFKIVISKPGDGKRPKTMEDLEDNQIPLLDIEIPSWKLGNPRFSARGTLFFRGSSYAPTDDFPHSSNISFLCPSQTGEPLPEIPGSMTLRKPSPVSMPQIRLPPLELMRPPASLSPTPMTTPRFPPVRSTYLSTHIKIEPAMFDALTFKPTCDDRSIVRYSPTTGAVTAATPPRLVAEITSPSFLDYELISDFFLTYRAFLEPADLLKMLLARLRWALGRSDEIGMVVRVRTFVAIRHWILNYFMDDFVIEYALRVTFCNILNDMVDELAADPRGCKVQLKILAELKKCWRRVCAQFWDGPEFEPSVGPDVPITPGGIAGHRSASLDPSIWARMDAAPQIESLFAPIVEGKEQTSFYADVNRAGHVGESLEVDRPATPEHQDAHDLGRRHTASPSSVASMDIVSCSFPTKNSRTAQHATGNHSLGAHPAPHASSVYSSAGPVATTPKALVGKRVRPSNGHKRNGSMTDSLRGKEHATENAALPDMDFLMSLPYGGSLVRGNLMPPGQPYVEIMPPDLKGEFHRHTTVFQIPPEQSSASAMSGQGMRKLIDSVRRALGARGQAVSPTQGNFINISPLGPRGATTNRLPGTAIVPQARPQHNGVRPPVRIDLLGADIVEDFKKAIREDAAAEAAVDVERHEHFGPTAGGLHSAVLEEGRDPSSVAHMVSSFGSIPDKDMLGPISDIAITPGSKSIVIVDDTMPLSSTAMHGALPASDSVEAFPDAFLPTGADPTPPNTPPGQTIGTPRRSSFTADQYAANPSASADPLPPFVPDLETLGLDRRSITSSNAARPTSKFAEPTASRPPMSRTLRRHARQKSSKTNRSFDSAVNPRRTASFGSALHQRSTSMSFDATTCSEDFDSDDEPKPSPMPQPLRILRRRPGGDLRAVDNVGDLDAFPLRKSRSAGSLTTYSDSMGSSYLQSPNHDTSAFVDVASSEFSHRGNPDTFSLGVMAEPSAKRQISLFSTHSSKPIMRPSFEAEAQKLAQIPDDLDDDGGVESALLKLEGKYEKKSFRLTMEPTNGPVRVAATGPDKPDEAVDCMQQSPGQGKREHRLLHILPGDLHVAHPHDEARLTFLDVSQEPPADEGSYLSENSGASYCSIPLLERGLTDDGHSKTSNREWTNMSILEGPDDYISRAGTPRPMREGTESHSDSYEFVRKTESMERIKPGDTVPPPSEQSFFHDDSDGEELGSDISSELSAEIVGSDDFMANTQASASHRSASVVEFDPRPLRDSAVSHDSHDPPSPPMSLVQALRMSPEAVMVPELHEHQVYEQKPLPPTPDTTPTVAHYPESTADPISTRNIRHGQAKTIQPGRESSLRLSVHLPFTLAFDSEILAQQFTLIEKDALNEIDWKELIDMGWKNATNNDSRSWVDFLRNTDAHGVEVVIARFNIMVKWACSEIVLTQNIEERARCIIKFIHIASHCRRYRNFATMSQITIALTCLEISRLNRTWAMVPAYDIKALQELERLISPMRNFYNLRSEMESGSDTGCIPFVGIYTHDLLFNAQRPSEIASSPTTAPLVNFERCRFAATIVKTLLRLLEASTLYEFQPVEGITERCLWMSALSDEEIRKHSHHLE